MAVQKRKKILHNKEMDERWVRETVGITKIGGNCEDYFHKMFLKMS